MGFYTVLLVVHSILVLFLIMMVLVQRTDSDGMGGLGGGGGNQFMTGRSAANLMTRTTAILAAGFMITSLTLAVVASRMSDSSIMDAVPQEETAPVSLPKDNAPETSKKAVKSEKTEKAKKPEKAETSDEAPADDSAPTVPKPE